MAEQEKEKGLFGESFLAELFKIESFIEPDDDLCVGYLAIGTMNVLEKATRSWLVLQEPALKELEQKAKIVFEKYQDKGEFVPDDQDLAVFEAQALLEKKIEIVQQMLRVSVQERLRIPSYVRVQLAKGFIVAIQIEGMRAKPLLRTITAKLYFAGKKENSDIPPPHMRH